MYCRRAVKPGQFQDSTTLSRARPRLVGTDLSVDGLRRQTTTQRVGNASARLTVSSPTTRYFTTARTLAFSRDALSCRGVYLIVWLWQKYTESDLKLNRLFGVLGRGIYARLSVCFSSLTRPVKTKQPVQCPCLQNVYQCWSAFRMYAT